MEKFFIYPPKETEPAGTSYIIAERGENQTVGHKIIIAGVSTKKIAEMVTLWLNKEDITIFYIKSKLSATTVLEINLMEGFLMVDDLPVAIYNRYNKVIFLKAPYIGRLISIPEEMKDFKIIEGFTDNFSVSLYRYNNYVDIYSALQEYNQKDISELLKEQRDFENLADEKLRERLITKKMLEDAKRIDSLKLLPVGSKVYFKGNDPKIVSGAVGVKVKDGRTRMTIKFNTGIYACYYSTLRTNLLEEAKQ